MDNVEINTENDLRVKENIQNCDERKHAIEQKEVAEQEGIQVETINGDNKTFETGDEHPDVIGDNPEQTRVKNENWDIGNQKKLPENQILDTSKEDIGVDLIQEQIQTQSKKTKDSRKHLRRKKRSDARNLSDSEEEGNIERPQRRKKRKRHRRDTSKETINAINSNNANTKDTRSKSQLSPCNASGYDNYSASLKDSVQQPTTERVINTQNPSNEHEPRDQRAHAKRMDIFTVEGAKNRGNSKDGTVSETNETGIPVAEETRKKKKKKKKLHGLKKTRAAVGILPPIGRAVDSDTGRKHEHEEKSKEGGEAPDDDMQIPVTDEKKETATYPKPLKLCAILAGYPVISFLVVSLVHIAVFATTAGLVFNGYDVFPVVFDTLPLYIFDDVHLKELTWKSSKRYDGYIWRPVYGANIARGTRSQVEDSVEVIFERPGVNLLDKTHLESIKRMEDMLFSIELFQDEFCMLDYYRNCIKPQSILRFFDGTYADVDPVFLDPDFSNVSQVIYKAYMYNETRDYLYLFMGKDSVITPNHSATFITRSVFLMGWPLGIVTMGGRTFYGNLETLEDFLANVFRPQIEYIRDEILVAFIDVYYLSKILYEYDLVQQALEDMKLVIGSVTFIFVFMCFQTGSIVVTFLGVLSIVSSFLLTNLIYRYVFQYIYFGFFHVIAMFLILGIGADDLFVFYDTWRLTGKTKYPSDAHRLSDCYRKAAKTTFVTSCTTMMAFLVSGLSPLLPVQTFGIFAGVLVAINYVWVIVYFPSIIIIHHTKVKPVWHKLYTLLLTPCRSKSLFSKRRRRKSTVSAISSDSNSTRVLIDKDSSETIDDNLDTTKGDRQTKDSLYKQHMENTDLGVTIDVPKDAHHDDLNKISFTPGKKPDGNEVRLDLRESEAQAIRADLAEKEHQKQTRNFEDRNRVVRFLKNSFFFFMTNRVVKIVVPLFLLGVSVFFIHRATLIEPDTQQLRLWRDDHNYAKATDRHYTAFLRNNEDEYQRVYLIWGLLPADISDCNLKSAVYCAGNPQYDDRFDMNTPEAQTAFKGLCEYLGAIPDSLVESLHIRRDTISGKPQISCFTKAMEKYYQAEADTTSFFGSRKYPDDFKVELPVTSGNVTTLMSYNSVIYRDSLPADFNNHFEIAVSYWLTNAYTVSPTADYFLYNHLLTEKRTSQSRGAYYSSSGLYYGTKLQYMAIEINTTLNLYQLSYKEGLPIFEKWENFIKDTNKGFPKPLQRGMQVSETLWHWLHVQETLANSAIMGILVGLTSAWPILVLTTSNVVIGTLATVTIGLVTACVVGLIPLAGWKLGVLESINLCMVVGLSVDYVVHLAEAYRMSESEKRLDRVRSMLESIGLSVVSGAITTIGAAIFMLFAEIRFFYQFGIFIISTVGISLLFSLLGYTTFMSLCGPQDNFGSLKALVLVIVKYCRANPNKSEKTSCVCASPSEIVDRIYDRISYGRTDNENLQQKVQPPMNR